MVEKPYEIVTGEGVPKSQLPFSPATSVGGFVFVSGQASVDMDGNIVSDRFEGEMRRSLENAKAVLAAAGLTLRDVVQVRNYLLGAEYLAEFNTIYREYFEEPYPARTTIMGCLGGILKYEVEMIAVARM
jgi:2-iminobutanoate/2-iminopropanoate deaminase